MARNPVVLVHGYSDTGKGFATWADRLEEAGYDASTVHVCNYKTLTNEVSLRDIAEGFDRALRIQAGLKDGAPFDAVVHSTGMLVVRAWLTAYGSRDRQSRIKHIVGLAPATFGSPLAHKGRTFLGSVFKGDKDIESPDFMEAGNVVLDGLELGSRFTWDLAHRDLITTEDVYTSHPDTPYSFVFCGTESYGGIRSFVNQPGTDGTVRWAGCGMTAREIVVDLTKNPAEAKNPVPVLPVDDPRRRDGPSRVSLSRWTHPYPSFYPVAGKNHGSLLRDPDPSLVSLVVDALQVSTPAEFDAWHVRAATETQAARAEMENRGDAWVQFVVRGVDEREEPIVDYNVRLYAARDRAKDLVEFDTDVHVFKRDPSLRCFHVNLSRLKPAELNELWARVVVSSGTELVGYYGNADDPGVEEEEGLEDTGWWAGWMNLTPALKEPKVDLFRPWTTTLVDLRLNREPMPFGANVNKVVSFLERERDTSSWGNRRAVRAHGAL